jgi:hypothetical protein
MKERRYSAESIKSYRYCIGLLIKIAHENGWTVPPEVMPVNWAQVLSIPTTKNTKSIVRYAVRPGRKPSTFTEDDLASWCQERVKLGSSLWASRETAQTFGSSCLVRHWPL